MQRMFQHVVSVIFGAAGGNTVAGYEINEITTDKGIKPSTV